MATRLTLFLFIQTCACTSVPVIVLDNNDVLKLENSGNPFTDISADQFSAIILEAIKKSDIILIFVEENFSIEDLSTKDYFGIPYPNIHQNFLENKTNYLLRVVDPFITLQRHLMPNQLNVHKIKDDVKITDYLAHQYLYFADDYYLLSRVQRMRHHDSIIIGAYRNASIDNMGPVVAFYTGKNNPVIVRQEVYNQPIDDEEEELPSDSIMMVTDQALIRLSGVHLHQGRRITQLIEPRASTRRFARRRASTRVIYEEDLQLDFNFEYLKDGWLLDSVVLLEGGEEVGRTTMGVGAPYDWSYFCSEPLIIFNNRDKSYVSIAKYQVEPLQSEPNKFADDATDTGNKTEFRNTETCGTNFNCRILTGLFVAFIVISITLGGVTVLLDCKSNSRMDDPNQKPLVLVAQM